MFESLIAADPESELPPLPDRPADYDPANEPIEWEGPPADAWVDIEGILPPYEEPELGNALWLAQVFPLGPNTLPLLTAVPFSELTAAQQTNALRRLTEYSAYVESIKADLTVAIAGPAPATQKARLDDFSAEEIAISTNTSVYGADAQIAFARSLCTRLQATREALRTEKITVAQARPLSEATSRLSLEIAREIESKLLKYSAQQSLTNFTRSLSRWLAKLDPDWTARSQRQRREVVVEHNARPDGTGELYIRGLLEDTLAIDSALSARAECTKDELGGTVGQRKFAALRDWAEIALAQPDLPTRHGRLPVVNVTIDLATLLGLRNGIAEIPGVGAIPASAARWLLADGASLRRFVIDPFNGQLLDYGTNIYRVPPPLADYLIEKNVTSAIPHSTVPADGCDMEHNVPHQQGGPTDPINTTPVERRWHRAKTHGDWQYEKDPETGAVTWTSPTSGLTCVIDPYDYR